MTSPPPESDAPQVSVEPAGPPMAEGERWRAMAAGVAAGAFAFLVSGLSHMVVVVWGLGLWDMARPLSAAPPPSIMVELVPDPWKTGKPEAKPPAQPAPGTEPQAQSELQQSQTVPPGGEPMAPPAAMLQFPSPTFAEPTAPPIDPDAPTAERLAQMLQLPVDLPDAGEGGGAPSEHGAELTRNMIQEFKEHLQSCFSAPPEAASDHRVKVLIRVALRRDGSIQGEPALVQAVATPAGPAVVKNAIAALKQCQPYAFLPAEDYRQWRFIEVAFSAKGVL
ncbi:hypothetical protein RA307_21105 [Xanthobacteraceae bacterium Astr-EGSB]|uniref:hypothetical protein n=1 Tax=Astrobacterium formosum TaxID=3069710 RepID=UPI0027B739DB|nr:hypothetical protein [Xanthobacteraceae bacterium Astr-EGSB]